MIQALRCSTVNISCQTLLQWREDGKEEAEYGNDSFEALCSTVSVHFLPYILWVGRGHHVEGKRKETASLHNPMPIFLQQKKSPCVRSNHRGQSGRRPGGFATSSQLVNHPPLGAWAVSVVHKFSVKIV